MTDIRYSYQIYLNPLSSDPSLTLVAGWDTGF